MASIEGEGGHTDDPIRTKTPVIYSVLAAFVKPFVGFPKSSFFTFAVNFPDEAARETEKWREILESLEADLAATSKGMDQTIHFIGRQKKIDEDMMDTIGKKIFRTGGGFDVQGNEIILYCTKRSYPRKNDIERYQELLRRLTRFPSIEVIEKPYEEVRFVGCDRVINEEMELYIQEKIFPEDARFEVDVNKIVYDPAGNYPSPEQIESYRESLTRVTEYHEMEVIQNNYRLRRANQGMLELLDLAQDAIQVLINMAKSFLGLIDDNLDPQRAIQQYFREFYNALMDMKDECIIMLDEEEHSINSQLVLIGLICACQCMERPKPEQYMERKIFCVKMVKKYFLKKKEILGAIQQVLNPEKASDFDQSIYSEFVAFYRLIFNMFEYECVFPGGEYAHECKFFNQTFKINHYFIYRLYTGKYLDEHLDDITELKLCYIDYLKKDCLVTSSLDKTVVIWDDEGHRIRTFTHNSGVTCFDISDDGKVLVAGCADFTLVKTPLRKKKPRISIMRGHSGSIRGVVITQSKNFIYSISSDCCVCQWDNSVKESRYSERARIEPKVNWLMQHRNTPTRIINIGSSDDVITASNDFLLKVWEASTGSCAVLDSHTDYVSYAKLCPNERFLVSCSWDNSSKIWDINSERQNSSLRDSEKITLRHTLDGHMIPDKSMPRGYREMPGHSKHVIWCDIHKSGQFLITASNDATVKLWEIEDGLFLKTFEGHKSAVVHCVFINNGWWFASCSNDHTIRIWDWQNGNCVTVLRGHFGPVLSCVETPWGLVSRGKDKALRVWQLEQFYHYRYHFPGEGDGINHSHGHERQKALIVRERRESTGTVKSTRANKQFGFAEEIEESKTFESSDKVGSAPKPRANSGVFE